MGWTTTLDTLPSSVPVVGVLRRRAGDEPKVSAMVGRCKRGSESERWKVEGVKKGGWRVGLSVVRKTIMWREVKNSSAHDIPNSLSDMKITWAPKPLPSFDTNRRHQQTNQR